MNVSSPHLLLILIFALAICAGCGEGNTEKFEKMELKETYSTNGQEGVKKPPQDNKFFDELTTKSMHGASNIFLVLGKDVDDAIKATHGVVFGGSPVDRIYLQDSPGTHVWLVICWGVAGSEPPAFKIHSIERTEKKIRILYNRQRASTKDLHRYYAWIPLGEPKTGKLELEMWNQETKENVITRLCSVLEKR